jgi:DNA-binding MarR family transcriptional regulator
MIAQPSRSDGMEARSTRVVAPVLRVPRGGNHAPFELPLEQAMALAQIPPEGISESQMTHRLGMTAAEAARVRGSLLRRGLVQRTLPGRARAASRLVLTERGRQGIIWLDQLQSSLPSTLFDLAEPLPAGPLKLVDGLSHGDPSAGPPPRLLARMHRPRQATHKRETSGDSDKGPEQIFQRGFLNVTLGTGFFGTAVLVGIMMQTERAALVALGVGCFLAVVFFLRAGSGLFRHARVRAWFARRVRSLGSDRGSAWPRQRSRSGRALD